jgi:hypothetical protein
MEPHQVQRCSCSPQILEKNILVRIVYQLSDIDDTAAFVCFKYMNDKNTKNQIPIQAASLYRANFHYIFGNPGSMLCTKSRMFFDGCGNPKTDWPKS